MQSNTTEWNSFNNIPHIINIGGLKDEASAEGHKRRRVSVATTRFIPLQITPVVILDTGGINPPIITLWPRRSGVHDARPAHFQMRYRGYRRGYNRRPR